VTQRLLTLLKPETVAAYTTAGFWGTETLYRVAARHAAATPHAFAVRDRHRRLSYAELVTHADRLASWLAGNGLRAGERIAVWLPSRAEVAIALLACSRNGYVCCPSLHRDHRVGQVARLMQRMRAAALIAQPGYGIDAATADIFAEVKAHDFSRCAIAVDPADAEPFRGLGEPVSTSPPSADPNQIMYLPFTSGTTGEPKGVLHSDNTLLASAMMMARDWHLEGAALYTLSPLSHNLGLGAFITALSGGGELVVHDLPRGDSLVDRLEETGAAFLFGVPTHAIDLLSEMRQRGVSCLGGVRGFRISGGAAPQAVIAELMQYCIVPQSGYGMTETCSHQYTRPDDTPERILETSGRCCDGYEIRVWRQDDPDIEAAPGEIGEIGGRGGSLMLGYFDDQAATEAAFNGAGWFMTGDLGSVDEDGYLRITGRKKDVIIRGGRNIQPAAIEVTALRWNRIAKAAAFAVPDDRLGERVCLALVTHDAAPLDPALLLQQLGDAGLPRYDMPEFLLHLDEMPLTASGKILKRELARDVAEGRLVPTPVRSASAPPPKD
jgi:acyl-CoA synthetase